MSGVETPTLSPGGYLSRDRLTMYEGSGAGRSDYFLMLKPLCGKPSRPSLCYAQHKVNIPAADQALHFIRLGKAIRQPANATNPHERLKAQFHADFLEQTAGMKRAAFL